MDRRVGVSKRERQAVFLVGGLGTRLGALTAARPKPLMEINGRPFLEYLLRSTVRYGFKKSLFLCGYRGDLIREYFGDGSRFGTTIAYLFEESLAGTAGAIFSAADYLEEGFLLVNGDTLFDFDYRNLLTFVPTDPWIAVMALKEVADTARYGSVTINDHRVTGFAEKGRSGEGLINGGVYWINREIVHAIPGIPCSLENDVLPDLVGKGLVWGSPFGGLFIDIGLPEELDRARRILPDRSRPGC